MHAHFVRFGKSYLSPVNYVSHTDTLVIFELMSKVAGAAHEIKSANNISTKIKYTPIQLG